MDVAEKMALNAENNFEAGINSDILLADEYGSKMVAGVSSQSDNMQLGYAGSVVGVSTNMTSVVTSTDEVMAGPQNNVVTVDTVVTGVEKKPFYQAVKRVFDIICSALALIVLSPVLLITALIIRRDGGKAFYISERMGKDQKPFRMYKFRSMVMDADKMLADMADMNERSGPAFKIKDDPRITPVGRFIRKTCIDELPQLINVFKGEMSVVGPRPPLGAEVAEYTPHQKHRMDVTPGLTCFWQVRDHDVDFDEWVEMDLKYIRERSFLLDLKLIFQTVMIVLKRDGDR